MAGSIVSDVMNIANPIQNAIGSYTSGQELQKGAQGVRNQINTYLPQVTAPQKSIYDVGMGNLTKLSDLQGQGAFNTPAYNYQAQPFNYQQSPGYQWERQQGMGAIGASAAAGGGLLSGTTMKALAKYGAGAAAQDYGNAYNRYIQGQKLNMENALQSYNSQAQQAEQNYGRYQNLANMGQGAANQLSNAYGQAMEGMANADVMQANAKAGQTMGIWSSLGASGSNASQMAYNQGWGSPQQQTPTNAGNEQPLSFGNDFNGNIGTNGSGSDSGAGDIIGTIAALA